MVKKVITFILILTTISPQQAFSLRPTSLQNTPRNPPLFKIPDATSFTNGVISLDDGDWQLMVERRGSIIHTIDATTVPGNVYDALQRADIIPDPYTGKPWESGEVPKNDYLFRKTFNVPQEATDGTLELCFERISPNARVYLNGKEIALLDNGFIPHSIDVTGKLKYNEPNVLEIRLSSLIVSDLLGDSAVIQHRAPNGPVRSNLRTEQIYQSFSSSATQTPPSIISSGIFGSVSIRRCNPVEISSFYVEPILKSLDAPEEYKARVDVQMDNNTGKAQDFTLKIRAYDKEGAEYETSINLPQVPAGTSSTAVELPMPNAKLWWPHTLGEPHLYNLEIRVEQRDKLIENHISRFGLRTVELRREKIEGGEVDETFTFVINGVPVYITGANWTPDDLLGRYDRERLSVQLKKAKAANLNMLRVWGGGRVESEAFYELADELGVLIWQDFSFANVLYPYDDKEFLDNIMNEAEVLVSRVRSHPSLTIFCGDNERMWHVPQTPADKNPIYPILQRAVRMFAPGVPFWRSTPSNSDDTLPPNSPRQGTQHGWFHFGFGKHWRNLLSSSLPEEEDVPFSEARFVAEAAPGRAPPNLESIMRFVPGLREMLSHNPDTPLSKIMERFGETLQYHGLKPERNQLYLDEVGDPVSFDDFVQFSQLGHAIGLRYAIYLYRSRMWNHNSGFLFWSWNESWPGVIYGPLDYYLVPKTAYYFVKRAYAPQAVFFTDTKDRSQATLWVANSTPNRNKAKLKLSYYDFNEEKPLSSETMSVDMEPNNIRSIDCIELAGTQLAGRSDRGFIRAELFIDGELVSCEDYFPSAVSDLKLPQAKLGLEIEKRKDGEFEVTVSSDKFAAFAGVELEGINADFSDNFFNIPPGSSKTITCKIAPDYKGPLRWKVRSLKNNNQVKITTTSDGVHIKDIKKKGYNFYLTGVDVGRTKIAVTIKSFNKSGERGPELFNREFSTPQVKKEEEYFEKLARIIEEVQEDADKLGFNNIGLVSVGHPGRFNSAGEIGIGSCCDFAGISNGVHAFVGYNPAEELSSRLRRSSGIPQQARIVNDVSAQSKGVIDAYNPEKLKGIDKILFVNIGTGAGGAFLVRNRDTDEWEFKVDGQIWDWKTLEPEEMFLEIKAGEQQLILCGSDTTSVFEDWKVASERPRSSTKHVGPAFSLCGSAIKWMMCAVDRELISRGQNPLFLPWVYSSRSDEEKMRILSGVSEPVHRKLIRFGYKALSDEERLSLLGDNSPLTAEALGRDILDNPFFKDSETNRDSDAYKAAEAIAKFEGKVLGALLTKANQGDIIQLDIGKGEALDNPYWTETERSIVRGTTYALIGGSIGTKGRFSELLLDEAREVAGQRSKCDIRIIPAPGRDLGLIASRGTGLLFSVDEVKKAMLIAKLQHTRKAEKMTEILNQLDDLDAIDEYVNRILRIRIFELSKRKGEHIHPWDIHHYYTKIMSGIRHKEKIEVPECIREMPLPGVVEKVERVPMHPGEMLMKPDEEKGEIYVLNPGGIELEVDSKKYTCLFVRAYVKQKKEQQKEGEEEQELVRSITKLVVLDEEGNVVRTIDCAFDPPVHFPGRFPDPEKYVAEDFRVTRTGDELYLCGTFVNIGPKPKLNRKGKIDYRKWWDTWTWYTATIKCPVEHLEKVIRGEVDNFDDAWTYLPDATLFKNWERKDGRKGLSKNGLLWPGKVELPDGREMHLAFARFMRREKPGRNLHHAVSFATAARPEGPYEVLKIAYGPHRPQGEDTGTRYDTAFVGTTSHPIETPVGYFNVPHAGAITFDGKVYRLGFQIFDLDHPTEEIIYDSYFPILVPETDYEFEGWVNNVVYSCCVIPNLEDNQLILYYGTADRYIGKLVVTLVKNWRELTKEDLAKMQREEFERIKGIKRQLEAIYKQDIAFLNGNGDGGKMTRAESPAAARASSSPISIDSTPDIIGTAA